jgi:hypothetical protein
MEADDLAVPVQDAAIARPGAPQRRRHDLAQRRDPVAGRRQGRLVRASNAVVQLMTETAPLAML